MIVDLHTHFLPREYEHLLAGRTQPPCLHVAGGDTFVRYGPDKHYPLRAEMSDVDAKLVAMDRAGIDVSVLSLNMPGVDGLGDDAPAAARVLNDALAAATAQHPQRLSWLAVLPMDVPGAVEQELRRCVDRGARGAMIGSNVAGRALDLETDARLFATAQELDVPVMLHPAYPLAAATVADFELTSILGFLFDTTTATLRLVLGGMFDRYPQLKFVVSHVGSLLPFVVGRIDYLSTMRPGGMGSLDVPPSEHLHKLHVDSVCLWPPALRLAVEFFGADRVAFGSDHPYWPMDGAVDTLADAHLSAADARSVRSGSASALLGIAAG